MMLISKGLPACIMLLFVSGCMMTGPQDKLASEAAKNEKNLQVEATRIPLKEQPHIEVFVFTDSGEKPVSAPKFRDGYRIRISIEE
ncbi:MAG: hypothetical protein MI743_12285 [Sneathiellales bacterium]|nr:hypothetical protein [Sneathiellales bacterium]